MSLFKGNEQLGILEEQSDQFIHSEKLHVFIEQLLAESACPLDQLDAVAVTAGPGSYTGLRIGVSAAKGLCFALGIPLISVNSLSVYVEQFLEAQEIAPQDMIVAMLDARRMEVYQAVFNANGDMLSSIEPLVLDENSFKDLQAPKLHFIGDATEKAKTILNAEKYVFHDASFPSASALGRLAYKKYNQKAFEDLAYFEPLYIKSFVAGKPKKLL